MPSGYYKNGIPVQRGKIPWNKGKMIFDNLRKKIGEATKKAMRKVDKDKLSFWKGKRMSEKTKKKMRESRKRIGNHPPVHYGKDNNNWKGGITPANQKIRESTEYKLWREAVFTRDNFTCQNCLEKGGELHAHHILSFSQFPELRFAINNGITLCKECHKKTDSYLNV